MNRIEYLNQKQTTIRNLSKKCFFKIQKYSFKSNAWDKLSRHEKISINKVLDTINMNKNNTLDSQEEIKNALKKCTQKGLFFLADTIQEQSSVDHCNLKYKYLDIPNNAFIDTLIANAIGGDDISINENRVHDDIKLFFAKKAMLSEIKPQYDKIKRAQNISYFSKGSSHKGKKLHAHQLQSLEWKQLSFQDKNNCINFFNNLQKNVELEEITKELSNNSEINSIRDKYREDNEVLIQKIGQSPKATDFVHNILRSSNKLDSSLVKEYLKPKQVQCINNRFVIC